MVSSIVTTSFADAARQRLYEAVAASLRAEPAGPDALLLGNLAVAAGEPPLDAVVLRPHGITLLVLVPAGGRLSVPALGYGRWLLGGQPLSVGAAFDNPFELFVQQKAALEAWLAERLTPEQANLRFITGVVVFGEPVTFGPDVEPALNTAQANGFQLLPAVADLPRRLRQLATPEIDLSAEDLAEWAAALAPASPGAAAQLEAGAAPAAGGPLAPPRAEAGTPASAADFLGQKARQLWGWLGAADIPDEDPPYGYDPEADATARRQEKQQLEQLRQQLQADVATQLQGMAARESERERSIAQLRAELAHAPAAAAEAAALEARLAVENREKASQQAARQASQAEAAARNQELDAKIQQLSQLIERLNAPAPIAAPPPGSADEPALPGPSPALVPTAVASPVPAPPGALEPALARPVVAGSVATSVASVAAASAIPQPAAAPVAPAGPIAPVAPKPAAKAPVVAAPTAAPPPLDAAGARSGAPASPVWASYWAGLHIRWNELTAAAAPRATQAWAWLRQGQRRRVAAGGLAAVVLLGWGASHLGRTAPVPFQQDGRWGFADAGGQPVIAAQFTAAGPFREGRAVVARAGAYGFVDEQGKAVVAPAYDALNPYAGGFARARVGEAYTFIDEQGQEFDSYYFNALDFAEGHAAVLDHRGWHYISGPAEPDKPVIFIEAYSFVDGLARVKLPGAYTFITPAYLDDPGRGTKPFGRYQLATDFADGKARVTQNGRSFFIDRDGDEVK